MTLTIYIHYDPLGHGAHIDNYEGKNIPNALHHVLDLIQQKYKEVKKKMLGKKEYNITILEGSSSKIISRGELEKLVRDETKTTKNGL